MRRPRAPLPTLSDLACIQQSHRRTAWAKAESDVVPTPQRLGRLRPPYNLRPARGIRALACHHHLGDMAFAQARTLDAHEFGLAREVSQRAGADVAHGG